MAQSSLEQGLMRLLAIALLLTLNTWAQPWALPQLIQATNTSSLRWQGKQTLNRQNILMWTDTPTASAVQLIYGKRRLWRMEALFKNYKPNLRYIAHTPSLAIFRSWVGRRDGVKQVGEVTLALRLSDGQLQWISQPLTSGGDHPGTSNIIYGNHLYEIYLGPQMAPCLVARRLTDGQAVFIRDVPAPDQLAFDLLDRRVVKIKVSNNQVILFLVDKNRHWQVYTFSTLDGSLKSQRTGSARPGEPLWQGGEITP